MNGKMSDFDEKNLHSSEEIPEVITMSKSSSEQQKIGSFDWILNYSDIKSYVNDEISRHFSILKDKLNVLVIGCGTSSLSFDMASDDFHHIASCDNDLECVKHMKSLINSSLHNSSASGNDLQFYHYDIVEKTGEDSEVFQSLSDHFDIIIDKGTLDAILVEGSISEMLIEILRLLNQNGLYIICSFHSLELLKSILSIDVLQLQCQFISISSSKTNSYRKYNQNNSKFGIIDENDQYTLVFCTKISHTVIPLESLQYQETMILNHYYQIQNPFLNENDKNLIQNNFYKRFEMNKQHMIINNEPYLSYHDAYECFITESEQMIYTYDLFLDDIHDFHVSVPNMMNIHELLRFIYEKQ
jgi:2-polyprenyl-3-methyl-5-hydroxy-6-metoxy-1,4-benzoquinol methylase